MSTRCVTALLYFALAVSGSLAAWAEKPACSTGTIQTSSGPVCGMTSKATITEKEIFTASAYLGIPYAVPPVGSRRWQYATLFKGSAPLQATAYGNACPQSTVASQEPTASSSRCTDGQSLGPGESEDCLYLNVWVPSGATEKSQLPVMVFIPGGAFYQGSGGAPSTPSGEPTGNLYDGTYLAGAGKVIVVTFNYRLGALGFLAHGGKYNFGFTDQVLALQWVRKNIEHFGGDPHRVTLFGESAGGKSVGLHVFSSPRSAGLFQAAIMESNALGLPFKGISQSESVSRKLCASKASLCTTATTACDLIAAQSKFMAAQDLSFASISNFLWTPTIDHVYITGQPMGSATRLSVPLILGTNHDEGVPFVYQAEAVASQSAGQNPPDSTAYGKLLEQIFGRANTQKIWSRERYRCDASPDCTNQLVNLTTDFSFTCANRHLAMQVTRRDPPRPLYVYQFDQASGFNLWAYIQPPVPQCSGLVCHTDELPYVFNSVWQFKDLNGVSFDQPEESLAQAMGGYWTSFAKTHNPGSTWPLFRPNKAYRVLNESSSTANDPLNETANCSALWDGIGYETPQILAGLTSAIKTPKQ